MLRFFLSDRLFTTVLVGAFAHGSEILGRKINWRERSNSSTCEAVMLAAGLTLLVTTGLTVCTFVAAKRGCDFSFLGPLLTLCSLVIIRFRASVGNIPNRTISNPVNVSANEAINPTESAVNIDSFVNSESDNGKESPSKECDLQESSDHNLPDSPFSSSIAIGDCTMDFSTSGTQTANENGFKPTPALKNDNLIAGPTFLPSTSLDVAPFKSCYFQVPSLGREDSTL
ncbi:uncharacterized protein [Henckelia pumila]|uniref:uncharacterized protein isoform X2 n=1 Tax=Henckelia pumila TaxID=405737 RepID=UPI003C6E6E70